MRRYDEPVEVRRGGQLDGQLGGQLGGEGPEQFLWRGRLWKVRAVVAHWVETGPWWQSAGVRAMLGCDEPEQPPDQHQRPPTRPPGDLVAERELWRVEAGRGAARTGPDGEPDPGGVFDLSFDWTDGRWSLVGCAD